MSIAEEYRMIYEKEICDEFNQNIMVYDIEMGINNYRPLSHNCSQVCGDCCTHDCYKKLGTFMRKNIVFYCYGEEEIVENIKNGLFSDMERATKAAYKLRLPKRLPKQDGLLSELLLDAIIQVLVPNAYKMSVRTIFRQNDNNEIKGYDLTYFTNENGKFTFWLGQAKLGSKSYCPNSILNDLKEKYDALYMAKQIYFIADKPVGLTEEGKQLAALLNELNMSNVDEDDKTRAQQLVDFFKEKQIEICIPCLLSYENKKVYGDIVRLEKEIKNEIEWAKKIFENRYLFNGIKPKLIFIVFPIVMLSK